MAESYLVILVLSLLRTVCTNIERFRFNFAMMDFGFAMTLTLLLASQDWCSFSSAWLAVFSNQIKMASIQYDK